jgi:hypothetical protein
MAIMKGQCVRISEWTVDEILFLHSPGETEYNYEKIYARMAIILTQLRTGFSGIIH